MTPTGMDEMASPQPPLGDDGRALTPRADSVFTVMLRKSLPPALLAGVLTAGAQWVVQGPQSAGSGLFGALLAVAFFASALVMMARFVTDGNPMLFMAVGMSVYLAQVIVLLGVLILARQVDVLDLQAAGIAMLVVVLVWQVAQLCAWRSARVPIYDDTSRPTQESA